MPENALPTDIELARAVDAAVVHVNTTVEAAIRGGLRVELKLVDVTALGSLRSRSYLCAEVVKVVRSL